MWKVQHLAWAQLYGQILGGTPALLRHLRLINWFWALPWRGNNEYRRQRHCGSCCSCALQSFNSSDAGMGKKRTGKEDHSDYSFEAIIAAMRHIFYYKNTLHANGSSSHRLFMEQAYSSRFAEAVRWESLAVVVLQPPLPIGIWHDDGLSTARNNRTEVSPMLQTNHFSD